VWRVEDKREQPPIGGSQAADAQNQKAILYNHDWAEVHMYNMDMDMYMCAHMCAHIALSVAMSSGISYSALVPEGTVERVF
jgi:hypothetical protein